MTQDLSRIDPTPGPATNHYPEDCAVEDCLIHGIGRVERQPAGVQISMSRGISVRDTTIHDCARSGINISEGTWGGHLIERCDVFDTVLETHDHGSFNSWGRDRYWTSNHRGISEPAVKKNPKLPYLDAVDPVIIRDSRWRCDHGWDIDLDDGSSNYQIYNNLLLSGGLKFREGYGRRAWNNILVNNGFHPHVWFDGSGSEFRHNIVMKAHAPIGQPPGWGKLVDENLFISAADRARHLDSGGDTRSVSGNPMFMDPAAGDFRVRNGSPALKIGFRNFPMDQFGVKKPSLKAIAKTPVIPALQLHSEEAADAAERRAFWLGAALHGLEGEEFSAFGVSREDMGVQLVEVPAESAAAAGGLQTNDLIQGLNGIRVSNIGQLFAAINAAGPGPLKLRVVRNQRQITCAPRGTPFTLTETAADEAGFRKLVPRATPGVLVTTRPATGNEPPGTLTDGRLAANYGPVFGNGPHQGAYKLDLGVSRSVQAFTAWSHNQNGNRGMQAFTCYGSNAARDPGWNTRDAATFVPLGTIDTSSVPSARFTASSLRAPTGKHLGAYRWIVIETAPVTPIGENTAWQEFSVDTTD